MPEKSWRPKGELHEGFVSRTHALVVYIVVNCNRYNVIVISVNNMGVNAVDIDNRTTHSL